MRYGAKYLKWAKIKEESATALPTYEAAMVLGELNRLSDNPTFSEAKAYGDDVLSRYVKEFREVPIDVEILDIENEKAATITGAQMEEGVGLKFGAGDNAPYGGLGFYTAELNRNNVKSYQGVFYPKLKANMLGEEYSTKGETITLSNQKLQFMGMACENGLWKIISPDFATEAEAKAWVDGILDGSVKPGVSV